METVGSTLRLQIKMTTQFQSYLITEMVHFNRLPKSENLAFQKNCVNRALLQILVQSRKMTLKQRGIAKELSFLSTDRSRCERPRSRQLSFPYSLIHLSIGWRRG